MLSHRPPDVRRLCPDCSHTRSTPAHRAEKILAVWFNSDGSESHYCHHCGDTGVERAQRSALRVKPARLPRDNSRIANLLWQTSLTAHGTLVETYLRECRGINVSIPNTVRYLPARGGHSHAMITAFAMAQEFEPGVLEKLSSATAIHLTRLYPSGNKIEKRMLGSIDGQPLVLAPPNDGMGLAITEGIEDALSVHAATGLGAWAAGSASHLPRLAPVVPDHIDHVLVIADADEAGQKHAFALAETLLTLKFDVTVKTLDGGYANG